MESGSSLPVAFVDGGMSDKRRAWCDKRGHLVSVEHIDLPRSWRKPEALHLTPFERTLWLELDCEVRGDVSKMFADWDDREIVVAPNKRDPKTGHEQYANQLVAKGGRWWHHVDPAAMALDGGIMLYDCGLLIDEFRAEAQECEKLPYKDDGVRSEGYVSECELLSDLVYSIGPKVGIFNIDKFTNKYYENDHSIVCHHTGSGPRGHDLIKRKDIDYDAYIASQISQSRKTVHRNRQHVGCRDRLINKMRELTPGVNTVLCVGCRAEDEVAQLRDAGYEAIGCDIAVDPVPGVMFPADASRLDECCRGEVDAFVAVHSFEHVLDWEGFQRNSLPFCKSVIAAVLPRQEKPDDWNVRVFDFMRNGHTDADIEKHFPGFECLWTECDGKEVAFVLKREEA
jgi:hypothetical protein